jgi:CheY-like chemotaxis protein
MNPHPLAGKSLVVLNTSAETIELLKAWFEGEGMTVHPATVTEFRTGGGDIAAFLAKAAPDVIIYDVALPYVANWQFLQQLQMDGSFKDVPLVVTTPNAHVLRTISDVLNPEGTHEIVGKPADMRQLTAKVRNQLALAV